MVNPYAFVPLGDEPPARSKPTWHDALRRDCLSGSFLVDITVRTPMLIGKAVEDDASPRRIGEWGPEATIVPGSAIAGSIRSVHEALTNSCLRVLDLDYVPVHRQFMSTGVTTGLRLALVSEVDTEGLPTKLHLLGAEPLRIEANAFPEAHGAIKSTDDPGTPLAFSGMRFTLDPASIRAAKERARARDEVRRQGRPAAGLGRFYPSPIGVEIDDLPGGAVLAEDESGSWVLYVSDTKARSSERVWYRAAVIPPEPIEVGVSATVRRDLARAVEGASDMHRFAGASGDFLNVFRPRDAKTAVGDHHTGPVIGRRRRVHKGMFATPGVPVWVALSGSDTDADHTRVVTEIRLAQAWRIVGDGEMQRRAGAWAPCRQPHQLCPSCTVFGSAGADEPDASRGAQQSSYRGHVRFEDAAYAEIRAPRVEATGETYGSPTVSSTFTRRPLGSPKPTAGQFYLDSGEHAGTTDRTQPLAQWGSPADGAPDRDGPRDNPRPLAGRKFYWATTSASEPHSGRGAQRGQADADQMVEDVRVVLPGAGFTARVTVDNLTRSQIGGLLAAIDTRLLGDDWSKTIGRLGGGRPFGWGAVSMRVDPTSLVLRGPNRYTSADAPSGVTIEGLIKDFLSTHHGVVPEQVGGRISQLRRVLTLDAVADSAVAYPGDAGGDPFREWKNSSGITVKENGRAVHRRLGRPPLPLDVPGAMS